MRCEELSEELSAYLDDELSPEERAALEAHLERCPRCRGELESLRAVSGLVASLPSVEPSEEFSRALARNLPVPRRRRWLHPIPLFAGDLVPALAVAALVLIGVTMTFVIPLFTSPTPEAGRPERSLGRLRDAPAPPVQAEPADEMLTEAESDREEVRPEVTDRLEMKGGTTAAGADRAPEVGEQLAERTDMTTVSNVAAGRPMTSALSPKSGDLKDDRAAGMLAEGEAEGMAQSAPTASSAVKEGEEARAHLYRREPAPGESTEGVPAGGRVAEAEAPVDQVAKADARRVGSESTSGFYTVVLQCSPTGAGHEAFQKALDEFRLLRTPSADEARAKPLSEDERKEYSRIYAGLLRSPDVIVLKEIKVAASDAELIRAVFADKAELTYADPNTDVEHLRNVLTASRERSAARAAPVREETGRSLGLRGALSEARQRADIPPRTQQQLVEVILALKRTPTDTEEAIRRATPTLRNTPGRRGM